VDVVFAHCPREASMAAHSLAGKAEDPVQMVWKEDLPGVLVDVISNDVFVFPKVM
jgi:hypothetical protein